MPGQGGNTTVYSSELANITARVVAYAAALPHTSVVFALTTPYLCDAVIDQTINGTLNVAARVVMAAAGVPVLDPYDAIRVKCGGTPPTSGCPSMPAWGNTCWCPHCSSDGYEWLTTSLLAPAIRAMLLKK